MPADPTCEETTWTPEEGGASSDFEEGAIYELDRLLARLSSMVCASEGGKQIRTIIREYAEYRKRCWRQP